MESLYYRGDTDIGPDAPVGAVERSSP